MFDALLIFKETLFSNKIVDFAGAVRIFSNALRVFRPYHFDAYGLRTGRFFLRFSKEIARGAVQFI